MKYKVLFTDRSKKQLKKLNKNISFFIIAWIEKNISDCTNPRVFGKALLADKKGLWRYRIGDYRLICEIQDNNIIILILEIGHRKDIYKN